MTFYFLLTLVSDHFDQDKIFDMKTLANDIKNEYLRLNEIKGINMRMLFANNLE